MSQPIELRKSRDFGQVLSDSFVFLRQNFKPLFKAQLILSGFFILLGTVTSTFQYMNTLGMYKGALDLQSDGPYTLSNPYSYLISVLINLGVLLFLELFIYLVNMAYISVYLQKKGEKPTMAEVWGYFRYYFFRVLGGGFVMFLLIVVGCFLCFIPGIYLGVVFSLVIPIIVMENASFGYGFNKSFQLIRNNWWFVCGMSIVTGLIIWVVNSVASVPLTVITIMGGFLGHQAYTIPLIVFFSLLRNLLLLSYALPNTAIALCYFKLSEEKEGLGLQERMEGFGKAPDENAGLPTEEY